MHKSINMSTDDKILQSYIDKIADSMINELTDMDINYLKNYDPNSLIDLHNTLGMHIRNKYKLWNNKWTPLMIEGIDNSPNHPDAISFSIIELMHKKLSSQ